MYKYERELVKGNLIIHATIEHALMCMGLRELQDHENKRKPTDKTNMQAKNNKMLHITVAKRNSTMVTRNQH